jgi:hypothetical protein
MGLEVATRCCSDPSFRTPAFDAIDRFGARRMCRAGVELLDLFGRAGLEAFRFDLIPDKYGIPFPIFTGRKR